MVSPLNHHFGTVLLRQMIGLRASFDRLRTSGLGDEPGLPNNRHSERKQESMHLRWSTRLLAQHLWIPAFAGKTGLGELGSLTITARPEPVEGYEQQNRKLKQ